jgi:hypothetical protein
MWSTPTPRPGGRSSGVHGERRPLKRMDPGALAAYRVAAFTAIEAGKEADGVLHWRPEAIYAVAST